MSPLSFGGQLAGFSASGLPRAFLAGRRPAIFAALLALFAGGSTRAWGPGDDEANRQRMMSDMRASAASNDRANFDSQQRSNASAARAYGSGGGSGAGNSAAGGSGAGAGSGAGGQALSTGPQSVVATYSFTIRRQETPIQALSRLETEAAGGKAQSAFDAGRILYTGYGGAPRDEARARRWFCKAGDLGHAPAQTQCGLMLQHGLGGQIDEAQSLIRLKAAADMGDAHGQALYGLFRFEQEVGTQFDRPATESLPYLTKAADRGEMVAQATLGMAYLQSAGVPQDFGKALVFDGKAAAQGNPGAMHDLARIYLYGHGVPKDPAKAYDWARKSAALGYPAAMTMVGQFMSGGDGGAARDEKGAADWFRKAAEAGDPDGSAFWGMTLMTGRLVPKDDAAGARYARVAADKGVTLGQVLTAKAYYFGQGVPKDIAESARWFKRAAAQGDAESIAALKEADVAAAARSL